MSDSSEEGGESHAAKQISRQIRLPYTIGSGLGDVRKLAIPEILAHVLVLVPERVSGIHAPAGGATAEGPAH